MADPSRRIPLWLAAVGVVFGDIGTSPLYAVRQCFFGVNSLPATPANVMGILSLVLWSLIIVVSIKYLLLIMRQNNDGEGGIIALAALLQPLSRRKRWGAQLLIPLGIFGATLLYGDGTITPAISVMSAMEGLSASNPTLERWVLPLTVIMLVALFAMQRQGTHRIGALFGPVMLLWFVSIGLLGLRGIAMHPDILLAANPLHAMTFFQANGLMGFLVLGTVFLVVTGGEALYADLGHFGLSPIRRAWFFVVLPALVLNYFGQGALILKDASEAAHPFFHLAPDWAAYPLVGLATVATIIASQAVISGVFSLTAQAVRLYLLPRMNIVHTSPDEQGQVYIPMINWALMIATIGLAVGFGSADRLGAAYGLAVSADMAITTLLAAVIAIRYGKHPVVFAVVAVAIWLVDWAFLLANAFKFVDGGWYPMVVGVIIFVIASTWKPGRALHAEQLSQSRQALTEFLTERAIVNAHRLPGAGIYLAQATDEAPPILVHHLAQHRVLHEQVILLTIDRGNQPRVREQERLTIEKLQLGFARISVRYGFMEHPDIPAALRQAKAAGLETDPEATAYYLGRTTPIPTRRIQGMALWKERLFAFMSRNAELTAAYYRIPADQVVEFGIQVEI